MKGSEGFQSSVQRLGMKGSKTLLKRLGIESLWDEGFRRIPELCSKTLDEGFKNFVEKTWDERLKSLG